MATEAGHIPSRVYVDLNGTLHLNGTTIQTDGSPAAVLSCDNLVAVTDPGVGNDSSQGYLPSSRWFNTVTSREWTCLSNALGAATWFLSGVVPGVGVEPNNMLTQAGASTGSFAEEGNINRQLSIPGVGNGADLTDDVLFTYTMPANAFDVAGRGVAITVAGKFAANGNNKRIKLKFGATVVVDTGVITTNGGGWELTVNVFKAGAAASNTQLATGGQFILAGTHGGVVANTTPTEVESGPIVIQCTGSSPTTGAAGDVLGQFWEVNFMN